MVLHVIFSFEDPHYTDELYYQITVQYPQYDDEFIEKLMPANCGNISIEVSYSFR